MNQLVSIIITTFNRVKLLHRAVSSAVFQTYENIEIIIVDDFSTDNTGQYVLCLDDKRIRYVKHERNQGSSAARNTGMAHATGTYLCFLDDDDEYLPGKIEELLKPFAADPEVGFVYSQVQILGAFGNPVLPREGNSGEVFADSLARPIAQTNSTLIKRECVVPFDPATVPVEDWDFHTRILLGCKAAFVQKVTANVYWDRGRERLTLDPVKLKRGILALQDKFRADYVRCFDTVTHARFLRDIGTMFIRDAGDPRLARTYFSASLRLSFQLLALFDWLVSFLGWRVFVLTFDVRQVLKRQFR